MILLTCIAYAPRVLCTIHLGDRLSMPGLDNISCRCACTIKQGSQCNPVGLQEHYIDLIIIIVKFCRQFQPFEIGWLYRSYPSIALYHQHRFCFTTIQSQYMIWLVRSIPY